MASLRQEQYKKKTFGFGHTDHNRILRAEKHEKLRREQRTKNFAKNRGLEEFSVILAERQQNETKNPAEERKNQLLKWRLERERHKKLEAKRKKPAFKVGIVHHKPYSPPVKDSVLTKEDKMCKHGKTLPCKNSSPKKITKATEKRLLAKSKTVQRKIVPNVPANAMPSAEKIEVNATEKWETSFAPHSHKFKPPAGLSTVQLFGRIAIKQTPTNQKRRSTRLSVQSTPLSDKDARMDLTVDVPPKPNETSNNDLTDSSIETVTLRLSSDEQEENSVDSKQKKEISVKSDMVTKLHSGKGLSTPTPPKSSSPVEPVFFSPYVVCSRGKDNARKEQQQRRGLGRSPVDIPTKENVMQSLNISVEEEERTAQYFKFLLDKETERLKELCEKWTEIKNNTENEDAKYHINQAVGQTTLLINKKFQRFRGLVLDCETGKGEMLVTCKDLQGFWDMMYMEIEDCNKRFDKLEKLHARGWEEEQLSILQPVTKTKTKEKKKRTVTAKQSSLRTFILEAKQRQKRDTLKVSVETNDNVEMLVDNCVKVQKESPVVRNNRRSSSLANKHRTSMSAERRNKRMSLLQKIQLSETSKRLKSPLMVMKISRMCKTPEICLDDTISYVNSDQTPAKSILKQRADDMAELRIKSAHKVNFDDDVVLNDVPLDEEQQIRKSLAAAFSEIENYDFREFSEIPKKSIAVEKRLNFCDSSFEEPNEVPAKTRKDKSTRSRTKLCPRSLSRQNAIDETFSTLNTDVLKQTPPNSMKNNVSIMSYNDTAERNISQSSEDMGEKENSNAKVLRTRTVVVNDTPKSFRRSIKESTSQENTDCEKNNSPKKLRRSQRYSVRCKENEQPKIEVNTVLNDISFNENVTRGRRSLRKSVRFTEEDCMGCIESKSVLPMTPHTRRSRNKSKERKDESMGDLISWETPEVPARVRRSQNK